MSRRFSMQSEASGPLDELPVPGSEWIHWASGRVCLIHEVNPAMITFSWPNWIGDRVLCAASAAHFLGAYRFKGYPPPPWHEPDRPRKKR